MSRRTPGGIFADWLVSPQHNQSYSLQSTQLPSTARVLGSALFVVFLIEFLLMIIGLPLMHSDSELVGGLLDAGNLIVWSAPLLWWIVIRPFRRAALAEAEKFKSLVEGAPSGIVSANDSGKIVFLNAKIEKLFGYDRDELLGRQVDLLVPKRLLDDHHASRDRVHEHSRFCEMGGATVKRKDGTEFPAVISLNFVWQLGKPLLVAIIRDMTEQMRNRAALEEANVRLTHSLKLQEQHSQEITLLIEMAELLQTCKNQEEADEVIGKYARRLFPRDDGAVYLMSSSRDIVEPVVTWGSRTTLKLAFLPDDCWALRRGRMHFNNAGAFLCPHVHSGLGTSLCIPMLAQGETLGVFHLRSASGSSPETEFSEPQQRLALAVAAQIAITLASLRLRTTLWNQSVRDALTGIYNRRYMEESLERELRRAQRHQTPLGVVILDLDHFKQFNDTFGHAAGDAVLRSVGKLISGHVRGEDVPCRYGGEEFVILFPDMDLPSVHRRTEQLLELCRGLTFDRYHEVAAPVTLSAGIALFPAHGKSGEEVLHAADAALYQAKREGRDRVLIAGSAASAS